MLSRLKPLPPSLPFQPAQLHFAVSLIGLGNRLARPAKAPLAPSPNQLSLNQRSPHHPPTTRPENPSCRRLLTERLPVPQNGTPLRPHRDPISSHVLALFSGSGSLFPAPWSFDHLPPSSSSSRWSGPAESPFRFASKRFEDTALGESNRGPPGRRNSLLARVAQVTRLSTTDRVSATTLAAASAAPAASAAARARLLT